MPLIRSRAAPLQSSLEEASWTAKKGRATKRGLWDDFDECHPGNGAYQQRAMVIGIFFHAAMDRMNIGDVAGARRLFESLYGLSFTVNQGSGKRRNAHGHIVGTFFFRRSEAYAFAGLDVETLARNHIQCAVLVFDT
jgi:hypothetical protein